MNRPPDAPCRAHLAPCVVVMAKPAVPGSVKTRLIGNLSPHQAAQIHAIMLECVLSRASAHISQEQPIQFVLALDAPAEPDKYSHLPVRVPDSWQRLDQGAGDLGQRVAHVWNQIGGGPALFLGVDSPDVPSGLLSSILPALADHDAVVGPTEDGGYWTLAARRAHAALLRGIDWGTDQVYHQTRNAAHRASLRLATLGSWFDVDEMADLVKLRQRIRGATEPALKRLGCHLACALKEKKT